MPDNSLTATPGDAGRQVVPAAIETIRQKLPFLTDLTPAARRTLRKQPGESVEDTYVPAGGDTYASPLLG